MDKEIHIDSSKNIAYLYYTWKGQFLGFRVRRRVLAAMTAIEPNRGQTLPEIHEKLERIRELYAEKRRNRRYIWIIKNKP